MKITLEKIQINKFEEKHEKNDRLDNAKLHKEI